MGHTWMPMENFQSNRFFLRCTKILQVELLSKRGHSLFCKSPFWDLIPRKVWCHYVCQNIEKIFLPALQCVLSAAESNCSVFSQLLSQINLILRVWQISLFTCVSRSGNEGTEMSKSAILVSNFMGALQNFRALHQKSV